MKKHIYIVLAVVFLNSTATQAQDYFSFYNLGDYVVQTQNISPVYIPKNSFTFAVPGVNIGLELNTSFSANQLLTKNENSNTLKWDLNNLSETSDELNDIDIDLTVNLFYMAFKRKKGSFTIFANTRVSNKMRLSNDLLNIAANGINESFALDDKARISGYNEIGIGFTQTFLEDDKLAIAIRGKYLNGMVHGGTEDNAEAAIEIDQKTGFYTLNATSATANTSGLGPIFGGDADEFIFFTENQGWAVDIGATFKPIEKLTLEIAVNDIGEINWTQDVANYNIEETDGNQVYSGVDLRTREPLEDEALEVLNEVFPNNETAKEFKTTLSMKTYVSARYAITKRNLFTLAAFNSNAFGQFKPSYSLGYNRTLKKTTFGVLASMGGRVDDLRVGVNFAAKLGPFQLYAATDSVMAAFGLPEEAKGVYARLGLNFVFGYK